MARPSNAAIRSLVTLRVRLLHKRLVACTAGSCRDCQCLALATEALLALYPADAARFVRGMDATQDLLRWGYLNPEGVLRG